MSTGFTKLFSDIITSSIWSEDDKTRLMWITLLASADPTGYVSGSVPGMAAIARMTLQDAEKSIAALCAPDQYSRSKEYDGRRIMETEGGWLILNYLKYRQKRDPERRREQNRLAQQRWRERHCVSKNKPKSARVSLRQKSEDRYNPLTPLKGGKVSARDSSKDTDTGFNRFWMIYPKKVAKKDTQRAWQKLKPSARLIKTLLADVERRKLTEQWTREGGRFIPNAATYLNGERWKDAITPAPEASAPKHEFSGPGPSREFLQSQLDGLLKIPESERSPKDRADIDRLQKELRHDEST